MPRAEIDLPAQVIFGEGAFKEAAPLARTLGSRAMVTAGFHGAALDDLMTGLAEQGMDPVRFDVRGEPTVGLVQKGLALAKAAGCDVVIGFGGGSAMDAGKAIAALLTNPGELLDYLEVIGKGKTLTTRAAPLIAVPTTAGTGSEVTRNAVLAAPDRGMKVSLRSPLMLPRIALVDPELTYSLPPEITAATGMDALCQVIEPYVSKRANALTDLFCREGIDRAARSLQKAYHDGSNTSARVDMAYASLMGGLALANAGLGAAHGFASPIGGMFDAPHGAVCAALLPGVVTVNHQALSERAPNHPALARYREVAQIVAGQADSDVFDLVIWLEELRAGLKIPGLRQYGVSHADISVLVEKGAVASSMKANPIELTWDELAEILTLAL